MNGLEPIGAAQFDREAAWHLLRRAGFGPGPGQLERAVELGLEGTLGELLGDRVAGHDPALLGGARSLLATGRIETLQAWWMALILAGGDPLRERMTLAWHDHFATSFDKVDDVRLMHRQNELLRELALGDFRELLRAVAKDPAMLVWLDGDENRRGRPNENFAREVMELFALGIGEYTERDVSEAARAFTGWGTRGRSFHFRALHHDPGRKQLFGSSGPWSGEQALELILSHPACPRWVARRLLVEFVTDAPTEDQVTAVAAELVEAEWHIGRTLGRLLRSSMFFDPARRRTRIAGPVELIAFTLRTAGTERVAPAAAARAAADMGQALFRPPSVKGWDGGRAWIDAGTWLARHNFLVRLATQADHPAGRPAHRGDVVDAALRRWLPGCSSPDCSSQGLAELLRSEAERSDDATQAARRVVALILTAPEYHLT